MATLPGCNCTNQIWQAQDPAGDDRPCRANQGQAEYLLESDPAHPGPARQASQAEFHAKPFAGRWIGV